MKTREELLADLAGVLRVCGKLVEELQARQTGRLGARLLEEELNRGHAGAVALLELERHASGPDV